MKPGYGSVPEIAKYLGISPKHTRHLVRTKKLSAKVLKHNKWLIPYADADAYFESLQPVVGVDVNAVLRRTA